MKNGKWGCWSHDEIRTRILRVTARRLIPLSQAPAGSQRRAPKIYIYDSQAFEHFDIAHNQAKLWIKPLIEMASLAMLDSNFDYANTLLEKAKKLPNKSLEYKSIAMQFYTLRNQIEKSEHVA